MIFSAASSGLPVRSMQDVPNHIKFATIRIGAHFVERHEPNAPVLSTTHEQLSTFWKIGCLIFQTSTNNILRTSCLYHGFENPLFQQECNKLYQNIYEIVDDCDGEKTRG